MPTRVFYLCYEFPVLTQTFTSLEVRGLARRGVDLRVVSCRRSREVPADGDPPVDHLEPPLTLGSLLSLLLWLVRRPLTWLGLVGEIAAARYRDQPFRCWARGFAQLLWGARLADRISREEPKPHLHAQFVDAASTVAWVAARLAGATFSVANHTAYNPYILRPKLRHAALFVSISEFDRRLTRRMGGAGPGGRIEVVYQGIDVESWVERRPGPPHRPARLLSVAALREKKGHHVLVRALSRLPDAELTIVGEGPERPRLESLIARLDLAERVTLSGAEPPDRVRERMASADLFALACVRAGNGDLDGVPISLMEAMAAGVPVVSTRISGIPELIEDGEEGLLAPPGDAEALAARIRDLLDDPERARLLARAAREKVRRQHDARRSVRRLAGLLAGAARGERPAPVAVPGRRLSIVVNTLSVLPGVVGGGETYLVNLVRAMGARLEPGEEMILVCARGNAHLFPADAPAVSRMVAPLPGRSRFARLAAEHLVLPVALRLAGADVLLSPGNAIPPLAGVRHVLALQSMHYRFVAHQMSRFRVAYFRKLVPISAARAARVVCVSRDLKDALLDVVPRAARRATVVYEGTDLEAFTPGPAPGPGAPLLYVSSLNPFKRPDSVVRALGLLRREGFEPPPLRLAGRPDAPDRARVEDLARGEGVGDLVGIEGVVAHEDLPALYRAAACLVYPSTVETFGLPPLEAMACGCPVVASDRTSVPEVVGDAALVVDPDDIEALAAAIRRVLEDADLRADLRRRGFENVRRFTWDRAARETLAVIREAAAV